MSSRRKILLALLLALGAVVVAALLLLPRLVDPNRYRQLIEERAAAALGREVRLGDMGVSFFPIGVRVADFAIGPLVGEQGDLLQARSLRVGARLRPLLDRRLEVTSLVVEGPRVALERDLDGRWNVERLGPEGAAGETLEEPSATSTGDALSVASLRVVDGSLSLRQQVSETESVELRLVGIEAVLHDLRPGHRARLELTGVANDVPPARLELEGELGPLLGEAESRSLDLRMSLVALPRSLLVDVARLAGLDAARLLGERPVSAGARLAGELGAGGALTLSDLSVADLELRLRRARDGSFDLGGAANAADGPANGEGGGARNGEGLQLHVDGLRLERARLHFRDESLGDEPLELTLEEVGLELDRLPLEEAAMIEAQARLVTESGRGSLEIAGSLGPVARAGTALELRIDGADVPLALLSPWLPESSRITGGGGRIRTRIEGRLPDWLRIEGQLEAAEGRFELRGAEGARREVPIDLEARYSIAAERGERLRLEPVEVIVGGSPFSFSGSLSRGAGVATVVDLTLASTRVATADVEKLAGLLLGELPFRISSPVPLEIGGRIRGPLGGDGRPQLEGRLRLQELDFRHPALAQPIEQLGAEVTWEGERLEVEGLSARVGSSDLAGRLTLQDFASPRLELELQATRADLAELLALYRPDAAAAGSAGAGSPGGDGLARLRARGRLEIADGSWERLRFSDLEATLRLERQVVTLEPVRMELYDGRFEGRLVSDLSRTPPAFDFRGSVENVAIESFIDDHLEVENRIFGRFTGDVQGRGAGSDYESLIDSLEGTGSARIVDGRLQGIELLRSISRVAGVFGQRSLQTVSRRLAEASTRFDRLEGSFRIADGRLSVESFTLASPDYAAAGNTVVDLLSTGVGGELRLAFSPELSELMQLDRSRAGELFYDRERRQVVLPLALGGSLDELSTSVDWGAATESLVVRTARRELERFLEKQLGGGRDEEPEAPQPPQAVPGAPAGEPSPSAAEGSTGLVAEITQASWGGSILAQDLELEGAVGGEGLRRAYLQILDAAGREVRRIDPLPEIENALAGGGSASASTRIRWQARIDGKRLLLVRFPITVRLVAVDARGEEAAATRTME